MMYHTQALLWAVASALTDVLNHDMIISVINMNQIIEKHQILPSFVCLQ